MYIVHLHDIEINEAKVGAAIDALKEQSAAGPDGIPARILKEMRDELVRPLTRLFKQSFEHGSIPDDWREAIISPIFKKGSKAKPENYRPVSLTNIVGKLMEKIVKQDIMEYIEANNLLSNSQHGFRAGRSTQTNLIEFFDRTTKWLDEGKSFDVLYLDFAKAFDKVCHESLIVKLEAVGIGGKLLEWLRDWLRGRKQKVRVEGVCSEWEELRSGVVQGSVLGGALFDIFIDDIDDAANDERTIARKFADDTKVAKVVDTEDDGRAMQAMIDGFSEWAKKWAMTFNAEKCRVVHVGRNSRRTEYVMDGIKVGQATEERDVGVWIEASWKPSRQCAAAAKAANFALGQLQRAFHYRRKSNLVPLYKCFVRPRLEFAVSAWSPWMEGDIKTLEKVQERLVRMLSDVKGNTYEEKLRDAGLTTLAERRIRGDAIETFKTLKGFNKVENWFAVVGTDARPTRSTTSVSEEGEERREWVLRVERANLEIRRNSFTIRAAKTWNAVPDQVKNRSTVNSFKTAYDNWKAKNQLPETADAAIEATSGSDNAI